MRLNSSALNARPLNGALRIPVYATAEAISELGAELAGRRTAALFGDAATVLFSDISPYAQRYLTADAVVPIRADFGGSVTRRGAGTSRVNLLASLFYMRNVLGYGTAEVVLTARGDVGVVFIAGNAEMHPFGVAIDGTRKQRASGSIVLIPGMDLSPSAVRRGGGSQGGVAEIDAGLDAAHVTAGGVRYITGSGASLVSQSALDAGMRRQALLGSMDFYIDATGTARRRRPSLAGAAPLFIGAELSPTLLRFLNGGALLRTETHADGEVLVRGTGSVELGLLASGVGYVYRRSASGGAIARIDVSMDGVRTKPARGSFNLITGVALDGVRRPMLAGRASIPVALPDFAPVAFRGGQGDLIHLLSGDLSGEILVPFSGDAVMVIGALMTGTRTRFDLKGDLPIEKALQLDATRIRELQAQGADLCVAIAELGAQMLRVAYADADMLLFSASDGYLNAYGEDIDEQQFYRPGDEREFARPEGTREFLR